MSRLDTLTVRDFINFEAGATATMNGVSFTANAASDFVWGTGIVGPSWSGAINLIGDLRVLAGGGEWQFDSNLRMRSGSTLVIDAAILNVLHPTGSINLALGATLNLTGGAALHVGVGATLNVDLNGSADFKVGSIVTIRDIMSVIGSGHIDVVGKINVESTGFIKVKSNGEVTIENNGTLAAVAGSNISFLGGTRTPKRLYIAADADDPNVLAVNYDIALIRPVLTANRTYTIDDTLSVVGDVISFVNLDTGDFAFIKTAAGATLASLKYLSTEIFRIDVLRNSLALGDWVVIGIHVLP